METKIQKIEEEIIDLKKTIKKYEKLTDEEENDNNEVEIKIDKPKELKVVNPEKQTVYCQCCNFTNSNHNAARLIFEIILIVLNLSSVCGLCYVIFMK